MGIFSLASGALLDYAKGNKHQHELNLLQKLLDHFQPRDLALADRGFGSCVWIALLLARQVQCLFRLQVPGYRSQSVTLVTTLTGAQSVSGPGTGPPVGPALAH